MADVETTYWSKVSWDCPECGGVMEPVKDDETVYSWEPIVRCYECGTVFDVDFEKRA